jgi:hypothetical protein
VFGWFPVGKLRLNLHCKPILSSIYLRAGLDVNIFIKNIFAVLSRLAAMKSEKPLLYRPGDECSLLADHPERLCGKSRQPVPKLAQSPPKRHQCDIKATSKPP